MARPLLPLVLLRRPHDSSTPRRLPHGSSLLLPLPLSDADPAWTAADRGRTAANEFELGGEPLLLPRRGAARRPGALPSRGRPSGWDGAGPRAPLPLSLRPWRRQAAEVGHGGGLRRLGSSTAGGMPRTHAGPAPRQPIQTLANRAGSSARRPTLYFTARDSALRCGHFLCKIAL